MPYQAEINKVDNSLPRSSINKELLSNYSAISIPTISQSEYQRISSYVLEKIGIALGNDKQTLVSSRLSKRLRHYELSSFGEYFTLATNGSLIDETQVMLDLLTTNETYLFREMAHFDFLRNEILPTWNNDVPFRAWSAACSTGEEAYSLALTINDKLQNQDWDVLGSDINHQALNKAVTGKLHLQRIDATPKNYLTEHCKKGINSETGTILICKNIRQKVTFKSINLVHPINKSVGFFDVIFLRNVLIYFNEEMRKAIVKNLLKQLNPGGYFFISHTETISDFSNSLEAVKPSIYRKLSD